MPSAASFARSIAGRKDRGVTTNPNRIVGNIVWKMSRCKSHAHSHQGSVTARSDALGTGIRYRSRLRRWQRSVDQPIPTARVAARSSSTYPRDIDGGRHIDKSGRPWQRIHDQAILIDRNTTDANSQRLQQPSHQRIARVFHCYAVARGKQSSCNHIEPLLGAVYDHDIFRSDLHSAGNTDVSRNRLAQRRVSVRITIHGCACAFRSGCARNQSSPLVMWKKGAVRKTGAKVVSSGASKGHRQRDRVPNRPGPERTVRLRFPGSTSRRRSMLRNKSTRSPPGMTQSLHWRDGHTRRSPSCEPH